MLLTSFVGEGGGGAMQLVTLTMMEAQLGADGLRLLLSAPHCAAESSGSSAPGLRQDTPAVAIPHALGGLRGLDLGGNAVGDIGVRVLAAALRDKARGSGEFGSLEMLGLSGNKIGPDGGRALGAVLREGALPNLQELDLRGNLVAEKGAVAVLGALKSASGVSGSEREAGLPNLRRLYLQDNYSIGVEGARALAAALIVHGALEEVDLGKSQIGPEGAKALGSALEQNATLRTLGLERCAVREDGARYLAKMLERNSTLETLRLGRNGIGDRGCFALAPALASNRTLQIIDLRTNNIGTEGAKSLEAALKESNNTLRQVPLDGNKVAQDHITAIASLAGAVRRLSKKSRGSDG
ncbi:hypothetical protein CYMTET_26332 [Cymbomonas tetramitiformis]|uniref:Uncharacterized protein n=1 Tax=Cymbomonas tetramitiformis TaxID=36881 RepID=A0AAE0KY95_9CHLO|nr:hypothetical protein CYMTET_26332 [Cymbomonas tetramitiformis]